MKVKGGQEWDQSWCWDVCLLGYVLVTQNRELRARWGEVRARWREWDWKGGGAEVE